MESIFTLKPGCWISSILVWPELSSTIVSFGGRHSSLPLNENLAGPEIMQLTLDTGSIPSLKCPVRECPDFTWHQLFFAAQPQASSGRRQWVASSAPVLQLWVPPGHLLFFLRCSSPPHWRDPKKVDPRLALPHVDHVRSRRTLVAPAQ